MCSQTKNDVAMLFFYEKLSENVEFFVKIQIPKNGLFEGAQF